MARPIKEGMDYFPHDTDARNDLKLRKLRAMFGNDGYATYFILLENIYRQKQYELDIFDDETLLILAEECKVDPDKFEKILSKCLSLNLFDKEMYENEKILTSDAIKLRAEPIENNRARKREWKNKKDKQEVDGDNDVKKEIIDGDNAQRKEKESREKKNIEEQSIEKKTKENYSKENDECCCDDDFNIFKYLELRGFIGLSAIVIQQIQSDMELYSVAEVKNAIDIADDNGKHSYSYVRGILERRRAGTEQKRKDDIGYKELISIAKETGEDPF